MAESPLQALFNLGESILSALEKRDFDDYHRLVSERGTLLDAITSHGHPSDVDAEWEAWAAALSSQDRRLRSAADERHGEIQDALTRLEQVRGAQRSYQQPVSRRSILNENLRV